MAPVSTVAAVYALNAVVLAVGLVALLHRLEPEFDPSWRMLSEYSLGRYGAQIKHSREIPGFSYGEEATLPFSISACL